ncbi:MAG TPA: glycosyltransferase [Runella sp.]|nr:glycosyltransferase [Runella sp.]
MLLQQIRLLSIPLNLGEYSHFVDSILELAKKRNSSYVCVANVHTCVESYRNPAFAEAIAQADMVTPDGMPLKLGLKWLFNVQQERIAGPDLMPILLKEAEKKKLKVFFYGSTMEVLTKIKERCQREYPQLQIAGMVSPPYRQLSDKEQAKYIDKINQSGSQLVLVALGCPKQERWMASMKGKINAVMVGVGAAFPIMAGVEQRAPRWMQRMSLEWLYRLICNPRRLFRRYFVTNSLFLLLLIREKFRLFNNQEALNIRKTIIEYKL